MAAMLTLIIAGGTWIETHLTGVYDERFKSYTSIWVIGLSACIFLMAKTWAPKIPHFVAVLCARLAPLSYGVYLVHNLFVLIIGNFMVTYLHLPSIVGVGFNFILVSCLSLITVWGIAKVPEVGLWLTSVSPNNSQFNGGRNFENVKS